MKRAAMMRATELKGEIERLPFFFLMRDALFFKVSHRRAVKSHI
jgi:hypothetical protein